MEEKEEHQMYLLSRIAHDLRAPLHTMSGYLDLLLHHGEGRMPPDLYEFAWRARAGSTRLSMQLETQLLRARLQEQQLVLARERVSFSDVLTTVREDMELIAREKQVRLQITAPLDELLVLGDEPRLQHIFRILIAELIELSREKEAIHLHISKTAEGICCHGSIPGGLTAEPRPHSPDYLLAKSLLLHYGVTLRRLPEVRGWFCCLPASS